MTPWTAGYQASLSFTISWSLLQLMSSKSVMPSNHLILYHHCAFSFKFGNSNWTSRKLKNGVTISYFGVLIILSICRFFFNYYYYFLFVVDFVIHWNETAMGLHVFPIPIPPPASLSTWSLWVFPVHQVWALVSCIQPGLVSCFTLDNIHVSMLFSWNIPPSPSSTESKRLFYKSVSLFLFCI